jgi:addiction module RelE/StbE family toxin
VRLRWTRRALRRLDEIGAYVSDHNPPAAARVIRRIVEQTETLRQHPRMGRHGRVAATFELIVTGTPYIVAYRLGSDEIQILTVLHAAQAWPSSF